MIATTIRCLKEISVPKREAFQEFRYYGLNGLKYIKCFNNMLC